MKEGMPEDLGKDTEGELQKLHDKYIGKIDNYVCREGERNTDS